MAGSADRCESQQVMYGAHELARQIDSDVHELEVKMDEKVLQTRDVFNEVSQRIGQVDARLKSYIDINHDQTAAYKGLIERVVRMETLQDAKPSAKASRRRAS